MASRGRPAVINKEKIREAITELEAERKEVTVIAVRERLGSGSYSTIKDALVAWRSEQAEVVPPAVPEMPEMLTHLLRRLWAEAWKAADSVHETERQACQRKEIEHERLKAEMTHEISRLEEQLAEVDADRESLRASFKKVEEEFQGKEVERAKAEASIGTLQAELTALRAESRKALDTVAAWAERASRAEARLEELVYSRRPIVAHLQMPETCVSGAFPSHPCVPVDGRRGQRPAVRRPRHAVDHAGVPPQG